MAGLMERAVDALERIAVALEKISTFEIATLTTGGPTGEAKPAATTGKSSTSSASAGTTKPADKAAEKPAEKPAAAKGGKKVTEEDVRAKARELMGQRDKDTVFKVWETHFGPDVKKVSDLEESQYADAVKWLQHYIDGKDNAKQGSDPGADNVDDDV